MKHFRFDTRCIEGTSFRSMPGRDDPYFEIAAGRCQQCEGAGCEKMHLEAAEATAGSKIIVKGERHFLTRMLTFTAHRDNDEPSDDGRMMQGAGDTEQEAIDGLLELIADAAEAAA